MITRKIYQMMGMLIVFVLIVGGYGKAEAMPQASAQGPKFYAYYYLWWSTNHWHEKLGPNYPYTASPLPLPGSSDPDGCSPVSQYAGNQLLDVPAALFSQDDPGQIESDIRTAKDAGLSGFWLNWQGDGSTTQTLTSVPYTRRLNEAFAASTRVGGFANWVSYQAFTMPTADTVINDLNFLYAQFGSNAAWEKVDGEPVVVFTGSRKYSDIDITTISNALRNKFYFVGDESATSLTDARMALFDGITYYWSSQDPYKNPASFDQIRAMGDKVHAAGKRWFAPFAPGYNSILLSGGTTCVPRRNGDTMRVLWNGNAASNPDGWGLISWNEIGENSHIQPLQKWGDTYVNVLSQITHSTSTIIPAKDTVGVFRPSNGALYLKNSNTTGFADIQINYGLPGDYPIVGDWDGDGTATIGIYRDGAFYLRNSNTIGFADLAFPFGSPGDQPVAGDWNGDGVDTIGVYRSSTGTFYLRNSNTNGSPQMTFVLGNPGDVGLAGDWDGDGKDTTGVFRPINGILFLKNTNETGFADIALNYGLPGDKPVTGDWNNDGVDTIGVYRGGAFYLRNSNTIGFADLGLFLGIRGDMPIAGNWDNAP
jgi:hypothetical protein